MKIIRYLDTEGKSGLAAKSGSGPFRKLQGDLFGGFSITEEEVDAQRSLLPFRPTQIFGVGLNYRKHAEETGTPLPQYPLIFMKNVTAACWHGDPIRLPSANYSSEVDYEGELAVVIGRDCSDASEQDALDYILGYTCANDVSARDWQKKWGGGQFCRGKSFNGFCPLGPWIVTADEVPDPSVLQLSTRVNGELRQQGDASDLIFSIPRIVSFLSRSATLAAGTVILTGTPGGVGAAMSPPSYLKDGDVVEVSISQIGELSNPVRGD
ncbi:fumarylacetoacetate hydrolase family protein [Pelagicoccus sp. SDUM812003]|uniref:fumarylacetoacetate hydrolase family protein n=1 Tax=Pelagicoccus sp. SDUM812003 TaxID=3041267 RepID=UPI00280DB94B|nr:fumarylacetoacetate hydrolase family protein [Pelagicoccus sp. SDUM812003]MDQ8203119.1 fumarylacetoacetate hydrolase family protein [Pelagicoccus sp. SDUM812003]